MLPEPTIIGIIGLQTLNSKQSKHGLLLVHRLCLISSPLIGVGYEITNNELPRVCGREPSHLAMAKKHHVEKARLDLQSAKTGGSRMQMELIK